jgi:hypothetical protein
MKAGRPKKDPTILQGERRGRPRKWASEKARNRAKTAAYAKRQAAKGLVRHSDTRRYIGKAALTVWGKHKPAPTVADTYLCETCQNNFRTWKNVRFMTPCARCLHAWNALLAKRGVAMSRGMFVDGAPHGEGALIYLDMGPGASHSNPREDYDKANESEWQGKTERKAGNYQRPR